MKKRGQNVSILQVELIIVLLLVKVFEKWWAILHLQGFVFSFPFSFKFWMSSAYYRIFIYYRYLNYKIRKKATPMLRCLNIYKNKIDYDDDDDEDE